MFKINRDRFRSYVDWMGSLMGIWWLWIFTAIVIVLSVGILKTTLFLFLVALFVALKVVTGKQGDLENTLNSFKEDLAEWWANKPKDKK